MEKFASFLPLHLIAVLVASNGDYRLRYLLKGVRLLHSLCDIASRNNRLEQVCCCLIIFMRNSYWTRGPHAFATCDSYFNFCMKFLVVLNSWGSSC